MAFPGLQGLFKLLFFADIEKNSADVTRHPVLILDQAGTRANPLAASGRSAHLEGDVETAVATDRLLKGMAYNLWMTVRVGEAEVQVPAALQPAE